MKPGYPGQGDPWADFLYHRHRAIMEFIKDGKSHEAIAQILSMDAEQVMLISRSGFKAAEGIFSRTNLAKAAIKADPRTQ